MPRDKTLQGCALSPSVAGAHENSSEHRDAVVYDDRLSAWATDRRI